ncbi:MAG: hypothetical protein KC646_16440 [Candidatus Cloacimonetes bacterium]|nr:hypothetical protein [Candidatus Cloacimonadota bacterium]
MLKKIFPLSIFILNGNYLDFACIVIVLLMIVFISIYGNYFFNNIEYLALVSKVDVGQYSETKFQFRALCIVSFIAMYFCPLELKSEKKND